MLRATAFGDGEAARLLQHRQYGPVSPEKRAVVAPCRDYFVGVGDQPAQPRIVPGTDRMRRTAQQTRRRGAKCEEVGDRELAKAPIARESHAATNRPIVHPVIGSRGIQSNKKQRSASRVPYTAERVPIPTIRREHCRSLHWRYVDRW
jgi:hypothetical protein